MSATLRARVERGLAWKAVTQVVLLAARMIAAVLYAWLLSPEQYGLAMMAVVVATLGLVFSDLALGAALVQRQELTQADRSTAFWVSVLAGAAFMGLGIAGAGAAADLYGDPRVAPLIAAVSASFLITAVGATHTTLLTRDMQFRSLELRMMGGVLAGLAVGVTAAALGAGPTAIVAQHVTAAAVASVLAWRSMDWRPSWTISWRSLRALSGFSLRVFASRVLFYVSRNADSLLIGRFLGPAALGFYTLAYNLMLLPFSRLAGPLQEVLFPAFSRLQDDVARMASVWLRVNRAVAALALPAMLGLVVVAPDAVPTVLGAKWEPAVPVIQVLAGVGALQSLVRLNSSVLQARDRTGLLLGWSVLIAAANLVAFAIGLRWGIVGVACAYAVTNLLLQPLNLWGTARVLGLRGRALVAAMAGTLEAAAVMLVACVAAREALVQAGAPAALRMLIVTAAGIAVYVAMSAWRAPDVAAEVARIRERLRARRAVAVVEREPYERLVPSDGRTRTVASSPMPPRGIAP